MSREEFEKARDEAAINFQRDENAPKTGPANSFSVGADFAYSYRQAEVDELKVKIELNRENSIATSFNHEANFGHLKNHYESEITELKAAIEVMREGVNKIKARVGKCPFSDADKWGDVLEFVWRTSRNL